MLGQFNNWKKLELPFSLNKNSFINISKYCYASLYSSYGKYSFSIKFHVKLTPIYAANFWNHNNDAEC